MMIEIALLMLGLHSWCQPFSSIPVDSDPGFVAAVQVFERSVRFGDRVLIQEEYTSGQRRGFSICSVDAYGDSSRRWKAIAIPEVAADGTSGATFEVLLGKPPPVANVESRDENVAGRVALLALYKRLTGPIVVDVQRMLVEGKPGYWVHIKPLPHIIGADMIVTISESFKVHEIRTGY